MAYGFRGRQHSEQVLIQLSRLCPVLWQDGRVRWLLTTLLLLLMPMPASALGFDEALGLSTAVPRLRGLQAALAERERLDARLPASTGNPELMLMPGWGLGAGPIWQASLEQSWNMAGLARARRQAAANERAALAAAGLQDGNGTAEIRQTSPGLPITVLFGTRPKLFSKHERYETD